MMTSIGLGIGVGLRVAAGVQFGHKRRADFRAAAAAILEQKGENRSQGIKIGSVDDRPAETLGANEPRPAQDAEVRRHRIVRDPEAARDLARRQPHGLCAHENPEHVEAGALSQCRQGKDDLLVLHMSRLIDMIRATQDLCFQGVDEQWGGVANLSALWRQLKVSSWRIGRATGAL